MSRKSTTKTKHTITTRHPILWCPATEEYMRPIPAVLLERASSTRPVKEMLIAESTSMCKYINIAVNNINTLPPTSAPCWAQELRPRRPRQQHRALRQTSFELGSSTDNCSMSVFWPYHPTQIKHFTEIRSCSSSDTFNPHNPSNSRGGGVVILEQATGAGLPAGS
ncbi:uncharacterized protein TRIREDRAFT_105514 [Trichoderma reesei QM6a]|uniref:Predicted protein n=2 Tax=Hypocrea jecorina TaxID=51453 RepID=G0REV8_HYPJQ|nr:uncharacterized protein TRIREDRAFT_105514 [Trichoderma reesei QM6a]EGR50191.1 predicted protein [Trichoderma reesei QM6a]ETS03882.1 hypothetical protein M419DRAFT_74253 [Trichoderma reesei RUT C-30]